MHQHQQKEAGLILAARFCLYTENYKEAFRISNKILESKQGTGASTAFEMEATTIVQWCNIAEIEQYGGIDQSARQQLSGINDLYQNNRNNEQFDADSLMVWAKSRHVLSRTNEVLNILNQVFNVLWVIAANFVLLTPDPFLHADYCHVPHIPPCSRR